jgi:nucleoid-associated protein YgaU
MMLFRLVVVLGLIAASVPLRGEPRRPPATEKAARTHLATADRAFQKGDYHDALAHLQSAYAIDPRPEYLIVFAQVYRAMGDLQRAINACELYLSTAPQGPRANEARGLLSVSRAELDKKTAAESPPPAPVETSPPADRASALAPAPITVEPAAPAAPTTAPRRRRLTIWLSVGLVTVTVAGVALGLGLGLGLPRGPQTISFDPPR